MKTLFYACILTSICCIVNAQARPIINHTFNENVQFITVAFHPTLPLLAASARGGNVYVWDLETKELLQTLEVTRGEFLPAAPIIAFSPDGTYLSVVDGVTSEVALWDFANGERVWQRIDHTQGAFANCFLSDSEFLTSGLEGTLKLRPIDTGEPEVIFSLQSSPEPVGGYIGLVDCDQKARTVLLSSVYNFDNMLLEYNISSQKIAARYELGATPFFVAYSPDFSYVAATGSTSGVRIWQRGEATPLATFTTQGKPGNVAFGPDQLFLFGDSLGNLNLTHLNNLSSVETLTPHSGLVFDITLDPSGRYLATIGEDKTLILWTFE